MPRMATPAFRLIACSALAFAGQAALMSSQVQAQSRYAMTNLRPPFLGAVGNEFYIDSQNRVLGVAKYFKSATYGPDVLGGSGEWRLVINYNSYFSAWPASTATSEWPDKLFTNHPESLATQSVSPDGSKVLWPLVDYRPVVYDTKTRQAIYSPGGGLQEPPQGQRTLATAVNNGAWAAGYAETGFNAAGQMLTRAARWRAPNSTAELLSLDTNRFLSAEGLSINTSGVVAGVVNEEVDGMLVTHAAVWDAQGALRLLDETPGHLTRAVAIADNGTVLVERAVPEEDPSAVKLELHSNGQVRVLSHPTPGAIFFQPTHQSLSPDGDTVVGTVVLTQAAEPTIRAFIDVNGQTQDLTTLLRTKGVTLPSGNYFDAVQGVNAAGAMVASHVDASGKRTYVRLTPRP